MSSRPLNIDSEIVIIGSGAFGISAAYHLANAGYKHISVFDKGDYNNNKFNPLQGAIGASTDFNKLVRASYVDKVHFQNLALESIVKYYQWNQEIQHATMLPDGLTNDDIILKNTGYVRLDDEPRHEEAITLRNFAKQGLRGFEYDINNPKDVERSKITGWYSKLDPLNQRGKVKKLYGVLDSFAGVANANKALLWVKYLCERAGHVQFIYGNPAGNIERIIYDKNTPGKATGVQTKDGKIHKADYVVIAAGAWISGFLPETNQDRLVSHGCTIVFSQIPHDRPDLIKKYQEIPMINWRMTYSENFREDGIYMFPATDSGIIKIGASDINLRYLKEIIDSKGKKNVLSVPRNDFKTIPRKSLKFYQDFYRNWLDDLVEAGVEIDKATFRYDLAAQKEEFVIDFIPGSSNVIVSGGGTFHGFKFLPVIGRFVEGLISSRKYPYQEFFRFNAIKKEDYDDDNNIKNYNDPLALNSVSFVADRREYKL